MTGRPTEVASAMVSCPALVTSTSADIRNEPRSHHRDLPRPCAPPDLSPRGPGVKYGCRRRDQKQAGQVPPSRGSENCSITAEDPITLEVGGGRNQR
eukprot:CAMPEP_0194350336 /NCGR_PEP_ID=MMETSP0171-20130528/107581_1 /TAXON_ID=218684 /ORGANISM="Corethron pennatum, Strain L29A3" /LENGTH=96 /DNA_ID=CAMNT_0039117875 /DNA_START=501 /DNA_END=792 /DNA_ORIENTATION=-